MADIEQPKPINDAPFSMSDVLKEAWKLTKENFWFLLSYQLIIVILAGIFSLGNDDVIGMIWKVIGWFVIFTAEIGFVNSALIITRGGKPGYDQLYSNWPLFLNFFIAAFLYHLMVGIGLMLLIIPGLYLWVRYGFFGLFIIEQGVDPIESLKLSAKATEGKRWHLFWFFVLCVLLIFLGMLFFVVGLFVAIPVTMLAIVLVYRKLVKSTVIVEKI